MSKRAEQALAKVHDYATALKAHEAAAAKDRKGMHEWMKKAVAAGVSHAEIARVAGVSRARVVQVAPRDPSVETVADTVIHAQEEAVQASCVAPADTVPVLPATESDTSGVVTTRRRAKYGDQAGDGGRTIWLDAVGRSVRWILDAALAHEADRVFLSGAPLWDLTTGATKAEAVRAWAMQDPGEGWTAGAHYLGNTDLPVLKFTHGESGRKVRILRGAMWWGESDADVETCAAAWKALEAQIDAVPAFRGAGLADTPSVAGRALWRRTIPEGKGYPVLSAELRELLHATAGQGRIELMPNPGGKPAAGFTIMDGRLMYAALTWGLPVGEPKRWTGDQVRRLDAREQEKVLRGRGRWRITATVPADWNHVGLLMAPEAGSARWIFPRNPGETFTTWADGSEVWLARSRGWRITTHEGITWDEGKPLDTWRDALVGIWRSASQSQSPAAKLAAKALRNLIIMSIGAFNSRAHMETRTAPIDSNPDIPAGTEVRVIGDRLMWEVPGTLSTFAEESAHPEWSATVWARARTRLLSARGVGGTQVGALELDPSTIVGFQTDALFLSGAAPAWADDGEPGRFRVKGSIPGGWSWPTSWVDLEALKVRAESGEASV